MTFNEIVELARIHICSRCLDIDCHKCQWEMERVILEVERIMEGGKHEELESNMG